jgi:hypothetical protein
LRNKGEKISDYKTAAMHVRAKSTTHFARAAPALMVTNQSGI